VGQANAFGVAGGAARIHDVSPIVGDGRGWLLGLRRRRLFEVGERVDGDAGSFGGGAVVVIEVLEEDYVLEALALALEQILEL